MSHKVNWIFGFVMMWAIGLSGCGRATYPISEVEKGIREICEKEYNIQSVDVKLAGKTVTVFLPLQKLFAGDVKKILLSGNISNLQSLFEPSPEAMEKVEDVFFAISRVLLSSDEQIDFYTLQATDIESTGLQLVLTGNVADVRRVRLWDIPRSEYRKRVLHELRHNRAVIWHKTIRELFKNVSTLTMEELVGRYFGVTPEPENVSPLFYKFLHTLEYKQNVQMSIEDIRSHPLGETQALVYVKFKETYEPHAGVVSQFDYPSGSTLEYIFVLSPIEDQFKIIRVIPLYYLDGSGTFQKVDFPADLKLYENLAGWSEEFEAEDINFGEFLARQLNRRVQELLMLDERVRNTLKQARFNFLYHYKAEELNAQKPYFAFHFDFQSKEMKKSPGDFSQIVTNEDVLYVLDLALREFVDLIRSYRFEDFDHFELVSDAVGVVYRLPLNHDHLELFRKKKLDISTLLETQINSAPHTLI